MVKTIAITEELWSKIAKDRITLGKPTMEDVIQSYRDVARKINGGKTNEKRTAKPVKKA